MQIDRNCLVKKKKRKKQSMNVCVCVCEVMMKLSNKERLTIKMNTDENVKRI